MSDQRLKDVTEWLLHALSERREVALDDLINQAEDRFSPSDITWAIWYLKSDGRIRLTREDLVAAA